MRTRIGCAKKWPLCGSASSRSKSGWRSARRSRSRTARRMTPGRLDRARGASARSVLRAHVLQLRHDGGVRLLEALARLLCGGLQPLGRPGHRLSLRLEDLERLLRVLHALGEGLLVELDRVLAAVLPRRLPAQRRGLRVAQGLEGALLQLGVEPHAFLRARRPELDHLAQHALIGIGPDRHRLDRFAGDLAEELLSFLGIVHHGSLLLHLLFRFSSHRVSPYASPSGESINASRYHCQVNFRIALYCSCYGLEVFLNCWVRGAHGCRH